MWKTAVLRVKAAQKRRKICPKLRAGWMPTSWPGCCGWFRQTSRPIFSGAWRTTSTTVTIQNDNGDGTCLHPEPKDDTKGQSVRPEFRSCSSVGWCGYHGPVAVPFSGFLDVFFELESWQTTLVAEISQPCSCSSLEAVPLMVYAAILGRMRGELRNHTAVDVYPSQTGPYTESSPEWSVVPRKRSPRHRTHSSVT